MRAGVDGEAAQQGGNLAVGGRTRKAGLGSDVYIIVADLKLMKCNFKTHTIYSQQKSRTVGLEPTTTRLRALRSAD